jgi:hypothetical protein
MTPYIVTTKAIGLSTCGGRKPQSLLTAARHNLREIQAENGADYGKIDPKRMALNVVLIGKSKAKEVEAASFALFNAANIDPKKKRKDYNQAHETVISLEGDQGAAHLFQTIAAHADYIFGAGVVLSFVVHNDQGQPHCHVLTSPIEGGAYLGSKRMKGAALDGIKRRLNEITNPIGFTRKEKATRRDLSEKAAAVIGELERLSHPILNDPIFQPIMRMIQKDPSPLFEFLSLNGVLSPQTMAETRLRKERGKELKPRLCKTDRTKERSLSCVGIEQKEPSHLHQKAPALPNTCEAIEEKAVEVVELIRVRESDQDPNCYDTNTGEFIQRPTKPKGTGRLKANAWVLDALAARM